MANLNSARFEIKLEFGQLSSGKTMKATLFYNDHECSGYAVDVELPAKLKLAVSGKDIAVDTILDDQGNILQDLYVKIIAVSLDGFELNSIFLHQGIKFVTDQDTIITSYFGYNGYVEFVLDCPNVFQQIMSWQRIHERLV